jgi:capsular polysaccharide biosynthesis protein
MVDRLPLPMPTREHITRLRDATVTRLVVGGKGEAHLGAVYDAGGALVKESQRLPDKKYPPRDPDTLAEAMQGRTPQVRLPRAVYLGHAFTHFGHFLVETVPGLLWTDLVESDLPLLFHPFDPAGEDVFTQRPYGAECLRLLGISPQRIVMVREDMAVDELLLAPRTYDIHRGPRFDFRPVYRALSEAALRDGTEEGGRRIYLSRSLLRSRQRRLAKEKMVERRMRWRGFEVLYPERMSFAAQIRAAAQADVIAGVDGSALHLSAFMRPRSHMLVLETARRRNVRFLNALMDIETISVPTLPPRHGARRRRIDPAQLDAALDRLGCPPAPGLLRRLIDRFFPIAPA